MNNKNVKIKKIAYWGITGFLSVMLMFSGIGAILRFDFLVEAMEHVGLPLYFMGILGVAYVLAAITILAPGFLRLREWAHVGVFIAMTGAIFSHIMIGDTFDAAMPSLLLMTLNIGSYLLRPANRQIGHEMKVEVKAV